MRWSRLCGLSAALALLTGFTSLALHAATPVALQKDGAVAMAGRSLRCPNTRAILDSRLPNLGIAARGVVVFNPRLLNRHTDTVRLFVFHHECGHHHVGGSETGADCWAAKQGVRDGWLKDQGIAEVCGSFGNAPPTPTHPSGASRCASLRLCFARATAAHARKTKMLVAGTTNASQVPATPELLSGPTLVHDGTESLEH